MMFDGCIKNCIIMNNTAQGGECDGYGGGLYGGSGIIKNCLIANNVTDCSDDHNPSPYNAGGGIYGWSGTIENCTIVGNVAIDLGEGSGGGGLAECDAEIINCIIWDNDAVNNAQLHNCSVPSYSCIQDHNGAGIGNISLDPCFVNPDMNDFRLLPESSCINTDDPNDTPEPNKTDLDGNPRIIDGRIDIGAYEYWPALETKMRIIPHVININSYGKYVIAIITMPEGIKRKDMVRSDKPILHPGEIEAKHQFILGERGRCGQKAKVIAFFDRAKFLDEIKDQRMVDIDVCGQLKSGQIYDGHDTIRINSPKRKSWWRRFK